jgi:hypothetical protein
MQGTTTLLIVHPHRSRTRLWLRLKVQIHRVASSNRKHHRSDEFRPASLQNRDCSLDNIVSLFDPPAKNKLIRNFPTKEMIGRSRADVQPSDPQAILGPGRIPEHYRNISDIRLIGFIQPYLNGIKRPLLRNETMRATYGKNQNYRAMKEEFSHFISGEETKRGRGTQLVLKPA